MLAFFPKIGPAAAVYVAVSLFIGMTVREYARAAMGARLGDPTPRLWGRRSFNPKTWFDPFGTGFVGGLIVFLIAMSAPYVPPFAYGKPAAIETNYLKHGPRDIILVSSAGPAANLLIALIPGILLRAGVPDGVLGQFLLWALISNLTLAVFHLLPIPGLDGARMVGLLMHGRAKSLYEDLAAYLPLFVLGIFLLIGFLGSTVWKVSFSLCRVAAGPGFC